MPLPQSAPALGNDDEPSVGVVGSNPIARSNKIN
jgi:hypothetical protein